MCNSINYISRNLGMYVYLTLTILTGLMLDLKARISLSDPYRRIGTARYIHVCKNDTNMKY